MFDVIVKYVTQYILDNELEILYIFYVWFGTICQNLVLKNNSHKCHSLLVSSLESSG